MGTSLRALIVDDDPNIRLMCRLNMQADGLSVAEAADGQEALDLMGNWLPDVVITDLAMGRLDGAGLIRAMRSDDALTGIPVIVMTAFSLRDMDPVVRREAHSVFTKPFSYTALSSAIRAAAAMPDQLGQHR